MCLLAAATTFTACSSSDDLNGNTSESKADGFYMTLTVQTPTSNGTRSDGKPTKDATTEETTVSSGTLFLVDPSGKTVFTKSFSEKDGWKTQPGTTGKAQTISLEVKYVTEATNYKVYFLANTTDVTTPWKNTDIYTVDGTTTFCGNYADDNKFAMFNENDPTVLGDGYTISFKEENKAKDNAAKIVYTKGTNKTTDAPILLDRLVARIDKPDCSGTTIAGTYPDGASDTYKKAVDDAVAKVEKVEIQRYAISNLPNKSYAMQQWDATTTDSLNIPWNADGFKYFQPKKEFGTQIFAQNIGTSGYFKSYTDAKNDYVFENIPAKEQASSTVSALSADSIWLSNATAMYFEYKVTLKDYDGADYSDGTFYRFNNVIYTSISDLKEKNTDVSGLTDLTKELIQSALNASTGTPYTCKSLKGADGTAKVTNDPEEALSDIRKTFDIEIFVKGLCYYRQTLKDNKYVTYNSKCAYATQRNTIYDLTVKNIFNVGADVPNGAPTETQLYYMDVNVTVNPWVHNTQNVDLK